MVKNNYLDKIYDCTCDIYNYQNVLDENTKITSQKLIKMFSNITCKVSYLYSGTTLNYAKTDNLNSTINQKIKLFINNDIEILAGSLFEVKYKGKITKYKNTGVALNYFYHQEIFMQIYKDIT